VVGVRHATSGCTAATKPNEWWPPRGILAFQASRVAVRTLCLMAHLTTRREGATRCRADCVCEWATVVNSGPDGLHAITG
jgi:hypothetical protein